MRKHYFRHERVVLAEARADHDAADGPVLCAQSAGRAALVSRSEWRSSLGRCITRALHIMAVVQLRKPDQGPRLLRRRRAGGMPSMMAMRALKRRLSNVIFACMLADQERREAGPGGQSGTTTDSSVTGLTPDTGPSDKPRPGPATPQPKRSPSRALI